MATARTLPPVALAADESADYPLKTRTSTAKRLKRFKADKDHKTFDRAIDALLRLAGY